MNKSCTIGTLLDKKAGFGPGFDLLRLLLALLIMAFHAAATLHQANVWNSRPFWALNYAILPMFFALSGFLVSASAMRLSLPQFLLNRCLRIVPAFTVVIILSALIIGPFFTDLTLKEYFIHPQFFHYLTNIIGLIHFNLPGVFHENGQPGIVNAALWTIPYEMLCYILVALFVIQIPLLRHPLAIATLLLVFTASPAILALLPAKHSALISWLLFGRGTRLFSAFIAGCLFYFARYAIVKSLWIFAVCAALLIALSVLYKPDILDTYGVSLILCLCLTYIAIYIGLTDIPKLPVLSSGDYSYGIYLYHCPVMNSVYYFTLWNDSPLVLFLLSLPLAGGCAALSWIYVEKPVLSLRRKFSFAGKKLAENESQPPESATGLLPLDNTLESAEALQTAE